jgi:glycine cleavage system H protein
MNSPSNCSYTSDHEWILSVDTDLTIGITDYAQNSLGDVTFVELPRVGQVFAKGDVFGVVESVKAASDLYMPVDGEVIELNENLESIPELVNQDPYEKGWLIKIRPSTPGQLAELMSPEDYDKAIG